MLRSVSFSACLLLFLVVFASGLAVAQEEEEESPQVIAFAAHTLGDQALGISAGLLIPLFFQEFQGGEYHGTNLSLGGVGSLQWSAYLSAYWRMGIEVAGAFAFSPNLKTLLILPLTLKVAYLINVSRFEIPISLGVGVSIIRYREWSHLDIIAKPGIGAYWRYDHNWSFGINMEWWLDFQYVDPAYQPVEQARIGNFLAITPSLIYNF